MAREKFKKAIATFNKGYATYFGSLDIPDDVFTLAKNVANFLGGKLLKTPLTSQITGAIRSQSFVTGKSHLFIITPDSPPTSFANGGYGVDNASIGVPYYFLITVSDTISGKEYFLYTHKASISDASSATILEDDWVNLTPNGIPGWTSDTEINPDFFIANGDIRISDGNLENDHKTFWLGHIKRQFFGENSSSGLTAGEDNYLMAPSPSKPKQAFALESWALEPQHIKPPVASKILSALDLENLIQEPGEIGIYVQDPRLSAERIVLSPGTANLNVGDAYAYPSVDTKDTFSSEDRYATTFIYDHISESELSRDKFGNIGVTGFDCFTPPDVLEGEDDLIYEYVNDDGDKKTIHLVTDLEASLEANELTFANGTNTFKSLDVIRIASEKILLVKQAGASWSCVRGVKNTTPVKLSTDDDIYRVQLTQDARALSIVVGTGAKSAWGSAQIGSGGILVQANKSLGTVAQSLSLKLVYNASLTNNTANIGIKNKNNEGAAEINVEFKGFNWNAFVELINTGLVAGKTVNYPGWDSNTNPTVQTFCPVLNAESFQGFFEAAYLEGNSADVTSNETIDFIGGIDSFNHTTPHEFLSPRITGIKLYWQPKGEDDWYQVNHYDIKKCLTDDATSVMKKYFKEKQDCGNAVEDNTDPRGTSGDFIEKSISSSGNIGAWIEAPFLHKVGKINQYQTAEQADNSQIHTCICKSGFKINPVTTSVTELATVTNQMAAPTGAIVLVTTPVAKSSNSNYDMISSSYYGIISRTKFNGAKVSATALASGTPYGGEWDDVAFFGGSPIHVDKVGGAMTNPMFFDKNANTISFGASSGGATDGIGESLDNLGYSPGDFIFVSTNIKGHPNNGLYKILFSETLSEVINDDDTGTKKTLVFLDKDFREVAVGGNFSYGVTPLAGAKYLANDLGCTLSEGQTGMTPVGDDENISGIHPAFNLDINVYLARQDVIATRRTPHYGFKLTTYQGVLDRAATFRFSPVKWATSTVVQNQAVIGNVEALDENGQLSKRQSKILWTKPYKTDEFTLQKSRTIGKLDADPITKLDNFNNLLVVVKNRSTYFCDPAAQFRETVHFPQIGSKWKEACLAVKQGMLVANEQGIFLLPEQRELTLNIKSDYQQLAFNNPVLGYSSKTDTVSFVPDTSEVNARTREVYSINLTSGSVFLNHMDDPASANQPTIIGNFVEGATGQSEFLSKSASGTSVQRFVSTYNDSSSTPIVSTEIAHTKSGEFELKSKDFSFEDPSQIKYLEYIYITYKFNGEITLKVYTDGNFVQEQVLPAHDVLKNRKVPIKRQGKTIRFELKETNSGSLKHLELEDIIIEGYFTGKT